LNKKTSIFAVLCYLRIYNFIVIIRQKSYNIQSYMKNLIYND